jgi:hypothetical protein
VRQRRGGGGAAQCAMSREWQHIAVSEGTCTHWLNMELDLQTLFGLLCTAVLRYSLAETT